MWFLSIIIGALSFWLFWKPRAKSLVYLLWVAPAFDAQIQVPQTTIAMLYLQLSLATIYNRHHSLSKYVKSICIHIFLYINASWSPPILSLSAFAPISSETGASRKQFLSLSSCSIRLIQQVVPSCGRLWCFNFLHRELNSRYPDY